MSPDQLFSISPSSIKDDICFIWLDNTKRERLNRYYAERRSYSFSYREDVESKYNTKISVNTVNSYLEYLCDAFVVEKSIRYDVKGRKYIDEGIVSYSVIST